MIDKSVEMDFEARAALLTNDGYFGRVRELCLEMSVKEAWQQVESELPFGLRRFTHYDSFKKARAKEVKHIVSPPEFKME